MKKRGKLKNIIRELLHPQNMEHIDNGIYYYYLYTMVDQSLDSPYITINGQVYQQTIKVIEQGIKYYSIVSRIEQQRYLIKYMELQSKNKQLQNIKYVQCRIVNFNVLVTDQFYKMRNNTFEEMVHFDEQKDYITDILENMHQQRFLYSDQYQNGQYKQEYEDIELQEYSGDSDQLCCICIQTPQQPVQTHCKHIYCNECIQTWITYKTTCPKCRTQL